MTAYVPPGYENLVYQAAAELQIPPDIIAAQIMQESGWDGSVIGANGEQGLFQFMKDTWAQYGTGPFVNAKDPTLAFQAYVKYMKYLLQRENGNIQLALAAYNGGPNNPAAGQQYAATILQNSGVPAATYMTHDNSGISLANSNVAQYITTNTPTLSLDMLKAEYPLVAALVTSNPELQHIWQQAISDPQGTWSPDRFIAAVQNSTWWATHSDSARQLFLLLKADPATYTQNINNLEANIQQMAASLGARLSQSQMMQFAVDALQGGYNTDQAVLNQKFAQYVQPMSGNHFGGQAGTYEDQLRQSMRDLGVFMPENQLDQQIQQIIGGQQSVQGVQAQLRSQAAAMYPAYANQINSGMNLSDIASPFISRAQQLLETGPGGVNIQSPLIKNALQYTVDGQPTAMAMGDFEKTVRQDPRWLATDNAQDSFMSNAHRVLVDMGFAY